jgi:hypothetical protein
MTHSVAVLVANVAERVGFEPTESCDSTVFKNAALLRDRSRHSIPPRSAALYFGSSFGSNPAHGAAMRGGWE